VETVCFIKIKKSIFFKFIFLIIDFIEIYIVDTHYKRQVAELKNTVASGDPCNIKLINWVASKLLGLKYERIKRNIHLWDLD
jgi:hypothetical protein